MRAILRSYFEPPLGSSEQEEKEMIHHLWRPIVLSCDGNREVPDIVEDQHQTLITTPSASFGIPLEKDACKKLALSQGDVLWLRELLATNTRLELGSICTSQVERIATSSSAPYYDQRPVGISGEETGCSRKAIE
jgi:hypothetical protein